MAQVKDKAVGLLGLTNNVDIKLLHKCFELDSFDNLLKADYMDAIRARRDLLKAQKRRKMENESIQEAITRRRKILETALISQRMELQEHFIKKEEEINNDIEELLGNDENLKALDKEKALNNYFTKWLIDFKIRNPDDYFVQNKIDDDDIYYNIQQPQEFLFNTLEIFGLPKGYLEGNGHHLNWDKKQLELANARGKKNKKGPKKVGGRLQAVQAKQKEKQLAAAMPTYFDMAPF